MPTTFALTPDQKAALKKDGIVETERGTVLREIRRIPAARPIVSEPYPELRKPRRNSTNEDFEQIIAYTLDAPSDAESSYSYREGTQTPRPYDMSEESLQPHAMGSSSHVGLKPAAAAPNPEPPRHESRCHYYLIPKKKELLGKGKLTQVAKGLLLKEALSESGTLSLEIPDNPITAAIQIYPATMKADDGATLDSREQHSKARLARDIQQILYRTNSTPLTDKKGKHYLIMEFLPGENLESYAQRSDKPLEKLPLFPLFNLATQIATMVNRLHSHVKIEKIRKSGGGTKDVTAYGIIHADLMPRNIMISEAADGSVEASVIDFNISEFGYDAHNPDYQSGQPIVLPGYRGIQYPPETHPDHGNKIGIKTDIYLLAGSLAFLLGATEPLRKKRAAHKKLGLLAAQKTPYDLSGIHETLQAKDLPEIYIDLVIHFLNRMQAPNYDDRPDSNEVFRFFMALTNLLQLQNTAIEIEGKEELTQSHSALLISSAFSLDHSLLDRKSFSRNQLAALTTLSKFSYKDTDTKEAQQQQLADYVAYVVNANTVDQQTRLTYLNALGRLNLLNYQLFRIITKPTDSLDKVYDIFIQIAAFPHHFLKHQEDRRQPAHEFWPLSDQILKLIEKRRPLDSVVESTTFAALRVIDRRFDCRVKLKSPTLDKPLSYTDAVVAIVGNKVSRELLDLILYLDKKDFLTEGNFKKLILTHDEKKLSPITIKFLHTLAKEDQLTSDQFDFITAQPFPNRTVAEEELILLRALSRANLLNETNFNRIFSTPLATSIADFFNTLIETNQFNVDHFNALIAIDSPKDYSQRFELLTLIAANQRLTTPLRKAILSAPDNFGEANPKMNNAIIALAEAGQLTADRFNRLRQSHFSFSSRYDVITAFAQTGQITDHHFNDFMHNVWLTSEQTLIDTLAEEGISNPDLAKFILSKEGKPYQALVEKNLKTRAFKDNQALIEYLVSENDPFSTALCEAIFLSPTPFDSDDLRNKLTLVKELTEFQYKTKEPHKTVLTQVLNDNGTPFKPNVLEPKAISLIMKSPSALVKTWLPTKKDVETGYTLSKYHYIIIKLLIDNDLVHEEIIKGLLAISDDRALTPIFLLLGVPNDPRSERKLPIQPTKEILLTLLKEKSFIKLAFFEKAFEDAFIKNTQGGKTIFNALAQPHVDDHVITQLNRLRQKELLPDDRIILLTSEASKPRIALLQCLEDNQLDPSDRHFEFAVNSGASVTPAKLEALTALYQIKQSIRFKDYANRIMNSVENSFNEDQCRTLAMMGKMNCFSEQAIEQMLAANHPTSTENNSRCLATLALLLANSTDFKCEDLFNVDSLKRELALKSSAYDFIVSPSSAHYLPYSNAITLLLALNDNEDKLLAALGGDDKAAKETVAALREHLVNYVLTPARECLGRREDLRNLGWFESRKEKPQAALNFLEQCLKKDKGKSPASYWNNALAYRNELDNAWTRTALYTATKPIIDALERYQDNDVSLDSSPRPR